MHRFSVKLKMQDCLSRELEESKALYGNTVIIVPNGPAVMAGAAR